MAGANSVKFGVWFALPGGELQSKNGVLKGTVELCMHENVFSFLSMVWCASYSGCTVACIWDL